MPKSSSPSRASSHGVNMNFPSDGMPAPSRVPMAPRQMNESEASALQRARPAPPRNAKRVIWHGNPPLFASMGRHRAKGKLPARKSGDRPVAWCRRCGGRCTEERVLHPVQPLPLEFLFHVPAGPLMRGCAQGEISCGHPSRRPARCFAHRTTIETTAAASTNPKPGSKCGARASASPLRTLGARAGSGPPAATTTWPIPSNGSATPPRTRAPNTGRNKHRCPQAGRDPFDQDLRDRLPPKTSPAAAPVSSYATNAADDSVAHSRPRLTLKGDSRRRAFRKAPPGRAPMRRQRPSRHRCGPATTG